MILYVDKYYLKYGDMRFKKRIIRFNIPTSDGEKHTLFKRPKEGLKNAKST